jgi:hypothetical protein
MNLKYNNSSTFYFLFSASCLAILFSIFYFLFSAQAASAATIGLATTKDTFDLEIPAGDSYKGDLTVFNTSAEVALPVDVQLSLWNLKENSDDIEFITAEPALNATKWFEVNPTEMILEPDDSKKINFTIKTPKDVSPGTYLVMMRFQAVLPEHYFEEQGPRFVPELGVLFFIKVPYLALEEGKPGYGAEIISVDPKDTNHIGWLEKIFVGQAKAGVFEDAVKTLVAKVRNTGIYHFKSSGYVEIKNLFGKTVAKIDLKERYLLPNKDRNLGIQVLPPPPGKTDSFASNLWNSIVYQFKKNSYLGPYSATLTLAIPDKPPVVSTINFWVIPWKFWSPILAFGLLILYTLIKFRYRFGGFWRVLLKGKSH